MNRVVRRRAGGPAAARGPWSRGGRAGPGPSLTATGSTYQPPSVVRRRVPLYHFALMTPRTLRDQAELFRRLHQGPAILVLPNAWDVASARVLEQAGFPARATSSAGVAGALGYADGERITRGEMLEMVARSAARVRVPLTADMEAGYGPGPEAAAETARGVIAAGGVGVNVEDGTNESRLVDVTLHVERIHAVREAGRAAGVPLVINARTDAF